MLLFPGRVQRANSRRRCNSSCGNVSVPFQSPNSCRLCRSSGFMSLKWGITVGRSLGRSSERSYTRSFSGGRVLVGICVVFFKDVVHVDFVRSSGFMSLMRERSDVRWDDAERSYKQSFSGGRVLVRLCCLFKMLICRLCRLIWFHVFEVR